MDIVLFVLGRLFTRTFWFLVVTTFIVVLGMWARAEFRNQLFQAAANTVGKRFLAREGTW